MSPPPIENRERRRQREPIVRVWDRLVRVGHWLLAFAFIVLYARYRKFPLHAYAGYLVLAVVLVRIVWGFVGSAPARFTAFLYGPAQVVEYARRALTDQAPYYASHNPMGAAMVFTLLGLLLVNGTLGLMLYSSGQQLGPLGALVPPAWEDGLIAVHTMVGHGIAVLAVVHVCGTVWAARLHRENYILAMFSGRKRVPRTAAEAATFAPLPPGAAVPSRWSGLERWFNHTHPVLGSLVLIAVILAACYAVIPVLTELNRNLPAY